MAFGGGPLNSHVLHALAAMVPTLRAEPSRLGLSTSVSGLLTKVGAGLWGSRPPAAAPVVDHVAAAPPGAEPPRPVDAAAAGPAVVVSWTVTYEGLAPVRAVVVADTPAGARTIAESRHPEVATAMAGDGEDWIGRTVTVDAGQLVDLARR
jgi:acetyl-CoA C-acetyltransferase